MEVVQLVVDIDKVNMDYDKSFVVVVQVEEYFHQNNMDLNKIVLVDILDMNMDWHMVDLVVVVLVRVIDV